MRGTAKELAQLDGAFVVSSTGMVLAACRYLDAAASPIELPLGLGSRHIAAAHISSAAGAVGKRAALLSRQHKRQHNRGDHPGAMDVEHYNLGGKAMVKETQGDLAVITPSRLRSPD